MDGWFKSCPVQTPLPCPRFCSASLVLVTARAPAAAYSRARLLLFTPHSLLLPSFLIDLASCCCCCCRCSVSAAQKKKRSLLLVPDRSSPPSMKAERGAGGVEVEMPAPEPTGAAAADERAAKRRRVAGPASASASASPAGEGRKPAVARRVARRRRVQADAAAVQRLFQACRAVFRGPGTVPAPDEVHLLRAMLDRMRPEDFGLSPDLRFFRTRDAAQGVPTITHTTIYKCPNFSMVILFLPRNAVIPLHNHPGMTVFSKLLLGSMHIKSYDWVDPDPDPDPSVSSCSSSSSNDQLRLAKLVVDDVFTAPCDTSVLYPTAGGNMHRFTAITPCAILDVLGPPYSIEEDRDCTYYTDAPYARCSTADGDGDELSGVAVDQEDQQGRRRLAWLKEIEMPRELKMCSVPYGGPPISDK